MLETLLRPLYQRIFVDHVAKLLANKLNGHQVTFLSLMCGLLAAIALLLHYPYWAIGLLLLSGFFDTLDGTLARLRNESGPIGSIFDIVSDRIVEFAIIFALFMMAPNARSIAAMAMLGSVLICVTAFLVVGIFTENHSQKGFFYSIGLIERAEAFLFFIAMIVFPQHFNTLAWIFVVLVLLTAALHVLRFSKVSLQALSPEQAQPTDDA